MTRRGCLTALAGAAGACGPPPATRAFEDRPGLSEAAAASGLCYGAAARIELISAEPDLQQAVLHECHWLTPELAMKWDSMEPSPDRLRFGSMDRLADFARRNGKRLRGHTLIWHGSTPAWAERALMGPDGWTLVLKRFAAVIPRYAELVDEWDVVNEPMDTGFRQDGLRPSVFLQAFGPDYIPRSLEAARRLAPQARLMINEYGVDYDLRLEEDRRYLFLRLLERLKGMGAPLDGVGVQAHLDLSKQPFSPPLFAAFLQSIADLGLSITITELDIKEFDYALPVEERDRRVAVAAKAYLQTALAQPAVRGLATWGLSDRHSWLKVTPEDLARRPGAWRDGSAPGLNRGLPLDAAMNPKPLYVAIRDALVAAPKRLDVARLRHLQ